MPVNGLRIQSFGIVDGWVGWWSCWWWPFQSSLASDTALSLSLVNGQTSHCRPQNKSSSQWLVWSQRRERRPSSPTVGSWSSPSSTGTRGWATSRTSPSSQVSPTDINQQIFIHSSNVPIWCYKERREKNKLITSIFLFSPHQFLMSDDIIWLLKPNILNLVFDLNFVLE